MIEDIRSLDALAAEASALGMSISALTEQIESKNLKTEIPALREKMRVNLEVMKASVKNGMKEKSSASGLSGGFAEKLLATNVGLLADTAHLAAVYALAISEHNACMGRIASCPTAGSCGILPGALLALAETKGLDDEALISALFNAAAVGMVIAKNATLSGAKGGCAAECGSAGAMAASAVTELLGGTPEMCATACALALKAVMGLVCDPVAGLVEVPCVKRNASGAVLAFVAAELALAGIPSAIPADEVILAMKSVGSMMHESLRETSRGGIAVSKTAKRIEAELKAKEAL
jgi:L-serine dehydratase